MSPWLCVQLLKLNIGCGSCLAEVKVNSLGMIPLQSGGANSRINIGAAR